MLLIENLTPPLSPPLPRNPSLEICSHRPPRRLCRIQFHGIQDSTPALLHPLPRNPSLEFRPHRPPNFGRIDLHAGFAASTSTESKPGISAASTSTVLAIMPAPRRVIYICTNERSHLALTRRARSHTRRARSHTWRAQPLSEPLNSSLNHCSQQMYIARRRWQV